MDPCVALDFHKEFPPWDSDWGASMSLTDIYPDPNITNLNVPRPNICNIYWSHANNNFPLLQLPYLASQLIPTNVYLLKPTSWIPDLRWG